MASMHDDRELSVDAVIGGADHRPAYEELAAMADKRRARWDERLREGGYEAASAYDRKVQEAAAHKILGDRSLIEAIRERPWMLVPIVFTIVTKSRRVEPFFLNRVQEAIVRELEDELEGARARGIAPRPLYILKGRQQGVTSLITATQLAAAITRRNFSGMTLADTSANTAEIFKSRAREVLERLPKLLQPSQKYNNAKELYFDRLESTWIAVTATGEVGRSRTLSMCHFSEIATYQCLLSDLQASIGQAIVAQAIVFYETTANGFNQARDLWEGGTCRNLFFPWWLSEEYRDAEAEAIERICAGDKWLSERCAWLYEQGLDREQVAWYCKKYDSMLEKDKLRQEYPCFAEEAFIFSGSSLFDTEVISRRLAEALRQKPRRVGTYTYRAERVDIRDDRGHVVGEEWHLSDIRFEERADGIIKIHEEPRVEWKPGDSEHRGEPQGYAPYVIGGDTADTGEDYYTAKVVDNITGRTAATLRVQRTSDDLYAEQVLCLAYDYHMATVAIETNYSAQPMRVIGQKYGYTNLYLRERFDKMADCVVEEPGFLTTKKTKPIIVSELQTDMRERPDCDPDPETLRELLTFARLPDGSLGAVTGAHDDLVMALAIAHHAGGQAPHVLLKEKPRRRASVSGYEESPYLFGDELEALRAIEEQNRESADTFYDWGDI